MSSRRRQLPILLLLVALIAVAAREIGFHSESRYAPFTWGKPIMPGGGKAFGPPSSEPDWGPPTGLLQLNSAFRGRPFGDACISGLSMDLNAHRRVCGGEACDALADANFFWAVFKPDSQAAFFFELETTHEGGTWTAWLVHHGSRPAHDDKFPVYIEQGFLSIEQSQAFLQSLELKGIRGIEFSGPLSEGEPIYVTCFRSDGDDYRAREKHGDSLEQDGLKLIRLVNSSFVSELESDLWSSLNARSQSQGLWTFDNGTWPGEDASLFQEIQHSTY